MEESLIPTEAKAMIGKEVGRETVRVHGKEAQRFAAAVGDLNPLYFDDDFAKSQGYRGLIVPPLFLTHVRQGVTRLDTLDKDGIPLGAGGLEVPLRVQRRMAGGEDYEFLEPLYPDEELTAETRILDIVEKQGRSGAFVLTTMETTYTNRGGALVAKSRLTIIAR